MHCVIIGNENSQGGRKCEVHNTGCVLLLVFFAFLLELHAAYNMSPAKINQNRAYVSQDGAGGICGYINSKGQIVGCDRKVDSFATDNEKTVRFVRGLSVDDLRKVLNTEVYNNADSVFGKACGGGSGAGKEVMELWYQDKYGYLRHERVDDGNGTSSEVSPDSNAVGRIQKDGGTLLALVHNHPVDNVGVNCGAWPSNLDATNSGKIDQYIVDCAKDSKRKVTFFSKADGKVYSVGADGNEREWTFEEYKREYARRPLGAGSYVCPVDGAGPHSLYDPVAYSNRREDSANDNVGRQANVSGKTDHANDLEMDDVGEKKTDDSANKVGVRGWCKCGGKKGTECCCGYGAVFGEGKTDCRYMYVLCRRCGKCVRDPDNVFDVKVEEMLQKTKHMTTSQVLAERKKAQARLLAIPDGQIVIPGKCVCEKPDVIKAGSLDGKEFYVCLLCGRCYVPVNNTVPIGPTARSEMGLK